MKNSRIASFLFLTLIAASSFIMSCKSSSTAPAAAPSLSIMNAGSTYTMLENNNGVIDTLIDTVFATTMTNPLTKAKAIGLSQKRVSNDGYDTTYMSFESNGDVALSSSLSKNPTLWQVLPFVSHSVVTTTYSTGQPNPSYDTASAIFAGAGATISLNGLSYSTDSVVLTVTNVFTAPPISSSVSIERYTYIPQLGIIAIDNTDDGAQDRLISFSLK